MYGALFLDSPANVVWVWSFSPEGASKVRVIIDEFLEGLAGAEGEDFLSKLCYEMFASKHLVDPFEGKLAVPRAKLAELMAAGGQSRPLTKVRKGHSIDFGMMVMLGRFLQDPDADCVMEACVGVRIGVGTTLARTPAVWGPKRRWPLDPFEEEAARPFNDNYPSAVVFKKLLEE